MGIYTVNAEPWATQNPQPNMLIIQGVPIHMGNGPIQQGTWTMSVSRMQPFTPSPLAHLILIIDPHLGLCTAVAIPFPRGSTPAFSTETQAYRSVSGSLGLTHSQRERNSSELFRKADSACSPRSTQKPSAEAGGSLRSSYAKLCRVVA